MRKQETRKGKKAKRVRNQRHKRSHKRSHRHKSHKRRHSHKSHRQQGGDYVKDFTGSSIDGMPYTKEAVVVAGQDIMKAKDLQQHADYLDRQGPEQ